MKAEEGDAEQDAVSEADEPEVPADNDNAGDGTGEAAAAPEGNVNEPS